jgi:hypothetical protein
MSSLYPEPYAAPDAPAAHPDLAPFVSEKSDGLKAEPNKSKKRWGGSPRSAESAATPFLSSTDEAPLPLPPSTPRTPRTPRRFVRDVPVRHDDLMEEAPEGSPWFCLLVFAACVVVFVAEIGHNGWKFQPFVCPATCSGSPCFDDGAPCQSNLLLGPTIQVMDDLGAKDDTKIFDDGEWWRVFTCNWLHAGLHPARAELASDPARPACWPGD